jgi:hypothetical protein
MSARIFILTALLTVEILGFAANQDAFAAPPAQVFVSPDRALQATIIPVSPEQGLQANESRVELRRKDGKLLCMKDYSSSDGEHGYGVQKAQWTPDSRFFVYDLASSGGHQPYRAPTFFFSRENNRVRNIEEFTDRAVLSDAVFQIVGPHSVVVESSPDKYSSHGRFDIDNPILVIVNLQTGTVSQPSNWQRPTPPTDNLGAF